MRHGAPAVIAAVAMAMALTASPAAAARVDPHSAQAAADVVRHLAALLEARRFGDAYALVRGGAPEDAAARRAFIRRYSGYRRIHGHVGAPGDSEGAAGSIYIMVPLTLDGRAANGRRRAASGTVTLRRVNGVDGATPAQLRWHISQVDLAEAAPPHARR